MAFLIIKESKFNKMKKYQKQIISVFITTLILIVCFFFFTPHTKENYLPDQSFETATLNQPEPAEKPSETKSLPETIQPQNTNTSSETAALELTKTTSSTPSKEISSVLLEVPFVVQATSKQWSDPRFQDACEETSAFIATSWAQGKTNITQTENTTIVKDLAEFQKQNWGDYRDTSAADTITRIYKNYFNYQKVTLQPISSFQDIVNELLLGNLVVVPANGQKLENPYFTAPGPERHMIIIIGYDATNKEFITNDIGIGRGASYRYEQELLFNALRDYETGYHEPFSVSDRKVMIVIKKQDNSANP